MRRSFCAAVLSLLMVAVLTAAITPPLPSPQQSPTTIFLVRHSEKALDGDPEFEGADPRNPPLNAAGRERAEALARTLDEAGVVAIYSSPYERTRQTVAPLAGRRGITIIEHPAADVAGLAARVRAEYPGGVVVIVGHSNTVPALVEALGAGPVAPIEEAWEYDNVYVVTIDAQGHATVSTLKYGTPSGPGPRR